MKARFTSPKKWDILADSDREVKPAVFTSENNRLVTVFNLESALNTLPVGIYRFFRQKQSLSQFLRARAPARGALNDAKQAGRQRTLCGFQQ
jgi:hypothetical protein